MVCTIGLSWSRGFDYGDPNDRATIALLGLVGWTVVGISLIPEIMLDIFVGRQPAAATTTRNGVAGEPQYHGRYGRSNAPASCNWMQTALFLGGSVCQAFFMKREQDDDDVFLDSSLSSFFAKKEYRLDWEAMYLLSGCLFAASGLLSLLVSGCQCCCCRTTVLVIEDEPNDNEDAGGASERPWAVKSNNHRIFLTVANSIYFVASVLMILIVAVYPCDYQECFLNYLVMIGIHISFFVSGVLWLLVDMQITR